MGLEVIASVFVALVLLNAWTTRVVFQDDLSSPKERAAQIAFVWLVPFLGALLALHMKRKQPEPSTGRYRERLDPGDDFGYSRPRHRRNESDHESDGSGSGDAASSD